MVVTQQATNLKPMNKEMSNNSEFRLNSSRVLKFLTPLNVEIDNNEDQFDFRKRSGSNQFKAICNDSWSGVQAFCQAIDDIITVDKETELFIGKNVLELGFTTGVPSVFALETGAMDITMHSWDKQSLAAYVKPTIARNMIPKNLVKYTTGQMSQCLTSLNGSKFNVILCPELLSTNEENYPLIVEILDAALSEHGIILISGRTFYDDVSGSIQGFLDYIRKGNHGTFDGFIRWSSDKGEVNPHKVLQLTRAFN